MFVFMIKFRFGCVFLLITQLVQVVTVAQYKLFKFLMRLAFVVALYIALMFFLLLKKVLIIVSYY